MKICTAEAVRSHIKQQKQYEVMRQAKSLRLSVLSIRYLANHFSMSFETLFMFGSRRGEGPLAPTVQFVKNQHIQLFENAITNLYLCLSTHSLRLRTASVIHLIRGKSYYNHA
jgi:hypothetical protein